MIKRVLTIAAAEAPQIDSDTRRIGISPLVVELNTIRILSD
jgi:hypothetical protein